MLNFFINYICNVCIVRSALFIVSVVLCTVFCLSVVYYFVDMCILCVVYYRSNTASG
jgi:hypothetical protein